MSLHSSALKRELPLDVDVMWNVKPSGRKYGRVNALLSILHSFLHRGAALQHNDGSPVSYLQIDVHERRLTEVRRRQFSIVGHDSAAAFCVLAVGGQHFELFFNYSLFVEAETTFTQYYPSAAVIVRPSDHLHSELVRSPGSWGPDLIWITQDWTGNFILETCHDYLTGQIRQNFRGFKLVPSPWKNMVMGRRPNRREMTFLHNNGFDSPIIADDETDLVSIVRGKAGRYIDHQLRR